MANSDELLKALCRLAGVDDWRAVLEDRHLIVDGRLVGLIEQEPGSGPADSLKVYVELDTPPPGREGDIAQLLLQANVHRTGDLQGWFGLHAETQRVVYCFHIHAIGHMDARALADLLGQQVHAAEAAFVEFAS